MRLFVYEHLSGGGFSGAALPASLAREGLAMLRAVVEDLVEVPGVSVVTTVDERIASRIAPSIARRSPRGVELVRVRAPAESRELFDRLVSAADGSLIIAPETDGALLELTRRAEELGARILGPCSGAIAKASDKLELARCLRELEIPCLPAVEYRRDVAPPFPPPWVLKPRLGAGSTDTRLVPDLSEFCGLADLSGSIDRERAIVTPYRPGIPASVLTLVGEKGVFPLAPGAQTLSSDGRFRYLGGACPLRPDLSARAVSLARQAIGAVVGLAGFVGVDVILGESGSPSERDDSRPLDTVVEINPRLTTSYVGLRALARGNLASLWLDVACGRAIGVVSWKDGPVRFGAGGEVSAGRAANPACPA